MAWSFVDRRAFGTIVLERFDAISVPKSLKPPLEAFRATHRNFKVACTAVDAATVARELVYRALLTADAHLDEAVLGLANALVGAGLGSRLRPFAEFSSLSPSRIIGLGYARELREVRALVDRVRPAVKDAAVRAAVEKCAQCAEKVAAALGDLTVPQASVVKARAKRAALLTTWLGAFERMKKQAAASWLDHPETFASVFAPPAAVQRPVRKRKNGAAEAPAPDAPPPPPSPPAPPPPDA